MNSGSGLKPSMQPSEPLSDAVKAALEVFRGAKIIARDKPLFCEHCLNSVETPAWRRKGKMVLVTWPDGTERWQCHFCGRATEE